MGEEVILEQAHDDGWHVVAYASKMLDKHQKNHPISGKKLYAIVESRSTDIT